MSKKVVINLPSRAQPQGPLSERYKYELEALTPMGAEIVETHADTEDEFIAGAADADAVITSWGIQMNEKVIAGLDKCVVIGKNVLNRLKVLAAEQRKKSSRIGDPGNRMYASIRKCVQFTRDLR